MGGQGNSKMRRRCDRHYGFGPLYELPAGGPPGNPAPGAPATDPAPGAGGSGGAPPPAPPPAEQTVPYARFSEVNSELQKLRQAEEARQAKELADKGQHEQLANAEKVKREAAEQRAERIARRAVFISKASGKVTDADAAAKLAMADGLLDKIEVDDDGNAKDPGAVDKIVTDLVKTYEFLKPGTGRTDFGAPAGGNGPSNGQPEPKTAREMLSRGYEALGEPRRRGG